MEPGITVKSLGLIAKKNYIYNKSVNVLIVKDFREDSLGIIKINEFFFFINSYQIFSQNISSEIAIRTKIVQLQQNDKKMFFLVKIIIKKCIYFPFYPIFVKIKIF